MNMVRQFLFFFRLGLILRDKGTKNWLINLLQGGVMN